MAERIALCLSPFWLLGAGAFAGLVILSILGLILWFVRRSAAELLIDVLLSSAVRPVIWLALGLSLFTLLGTAIEPLTFDQLGIRVFNKKEIALTSIWRIPSVGKHTHPPIEIDGNASDVAVPFSIEANELREATFKSDHDLKLGINSPSTEAESSSQIIFISGNDKDENKWEKNSYFKSVLSGEIRTLYISNSSKDPATLVITSKTDLVVPEARAIPMTALCLIAYVGFFVLFQTCFRKAAAVAAATTREAISQPLFYLLMSVGCFLLVLLVFLPYFTFGEDVKQYKDSGLTLILVLSLAFSMWTASNSVADEIEGRTAMTILSKPISRPSFVIGKFVGITSAVAVIFILLGTFFLLCISYKVMYDAGETGLLDRLEWEYCYQGFVKIIPGLVLGFMEAAVLVSVSVALSTRLSMLPNLIICASIYVIGHLVPLLVQSTVGEIALVQFMSKTVAIMLPVLEYFNYYGAIASDKTVPYSLLGWTGLYALIYITIAMLLGLVMFEDRDLA